MRAGRLDKKINIINPVETQSTASGEMTITWSTFLKNRWANVCPLQGRELYQSKQWNAEVDYKITMRYATGLSPRMRVVYNGSSYHIHSIINLYDENQEIQLYCSRVTT